MKFTIDIPYFIVEYLTQPQTWPEGEDEDCQLRRIVAQAVKDRLAVTPPPEDSVVERLREALMFIEVISANGGSDMIGWAKTLEWINDRALQAVRETA